MIALSTIFVWVVLPANRQKKGKIREVEAPFTLKLINVLNFIAGHQQRIDVPLVAGDEENLFKVLHSPAGT